MEFLRDNNIDIKKGVPKAQLIRKTSSVNCYHFYFRIKGILYTKKNVKQRYFRNQIFIPRDATELEAGRLAKELEKAQMHLAKQQENTESTRIEFERMGAELGRLHDRLEKAEAEREALRQSSRGGAAAAAPHPQLEKHAQKLESDVKQLAVEREQLVLQLEASRVAKSKDQVHPKWSKSAAVENCRLGHNDSML